MVYVVSAQLAAVHIGSSEQMSRNAESKGTVD
jgi:hypothetical protein